MDRKCIHIITGLGDGGAEAALFRLCAHDAANQHHVISLIDEGKYGTLLQDAGVRLTCLDMQKGRLNILAFWKLWRLLRSEDPDVIQTWLYHADFVGGVIARLAGYSNIIWGVHGSELLPDRSSRTTVWISKVCARLSRVVPKHVVCCAEASRAAHVRLGYHQDKIHVIPNGYNMSVFQPDNFARQKLRNEFGLDLSENIIGFVARYHPVKDHETLLSALQILNQFGSCPTCLLVGTSMDLQNSELVKSIECKGLSKKILLLGLRNDIPAVMNAIDLHVMSSVSEAFPNVLAEAMACGTPCVTTDVGDAAEIVGNIGRVVPPRDPKKLASAISEMLSLKHTPEWVVRKEDARRHVNDRYLLSNMTEMYNHLWFSDN